MAAMKRPTRNRGGVRALASCAFLLIPLLLSDAAHAEEPLRIEEAVRLALANNERAQKAPLRVEAAEGQLDSARAAFLPTLKAGGSAALTPVEDRNGNFATFGTTVTLNQTLLNVPAFPRYAQAKHQLESE